MNDLKISEMLDMQMQLWEKNKEAWSPIEPEYGKNFVLWMVEEIGEVISIIKKKGVTDIMEDEKVRMAFLEEMSDVLMYYCDVLLRFHITTDEIVSAYINKNIKNMGRDYKNEYQKKLSE